MEKKFESITKHVFERERFKCDENISFYTGFPKYDTFVATFEFLNPGVEGENIRYCSPSKRGIPDAFYNQMEEDDLKTEHWNNKQGRRRKLKPVEEFFMVMCCLRRGFALQQMRRSVNRMIPFPLLLKSSSSFAKDDEVTTWFVSVPSVV